jgi:hypothetical protein
MAEYGLFSNEKEHLYITKEGIVSFLQVVLLIQSENSRKAS